MLAAIFFENLSEYEFFRPGRLMWALFVAILVYLGREVILLRASRAAAWRTGTVTRPLTYAAARGAIAP